MSKKYESRVAIVTGGASGIGLGIVEFLVGQGAKVAILDRQKQQGADIAARLGKSASFIETDVTSWDSLYQAFKSTTEAFGNRIDYVFANAGISQMTDMRQNNPSHFATNSTLVEDLATSPPNLSVINVNLTGVLYTVYLALAYFRRQEPDVDGWRGKIIATGSTASVYPFPNDTLYGTSKHGVLGMTRSLAPKVISEGITVNALAPPIIRTALGPADFFDAMEKEARVTPMSTLTNAVDHLIDPKCKLTGQLAELGIDTFHFRKHFDYLDETLKKNMNEFHSVDQTEEALALE